MKFDMKPLPYDYGALEPHISARTLQFHYDKHHQGYMNKLKSAIQDTPQADQSLEEIIVRADGGVFNSAAQVWNHDFYWRSMMPNGGGTPGSGLKKAIDNHFGGVESFLKRMKDAATGQFGSGWAWLVADNEGDLKVMSTSDAKNPLQQGLTPLLTIDVWEHAYYLDTQNDRGGYVDKVLAELINWDFAEANLEKLTKDKPVLKAV
ncbi:MAG: superoxide dismutase [Woeseia sp.]|nr:superoxide dismutase [Woeseia sp.]